jgi:hypothetical protein
VNVPPSFHVRLDPATLRHRDSLLGGTPFTRVRLTPEQSETVDAWERGAPVGAAGALARVLIERNLAQPAPPGGEAGAIAAPSRGGGEAGAIAAPSRGDGEIAAPGGEAGAIAPLSSVDDVTLVIPARDADPAEVIAAAGVARVIVVDDGSDPPLAGAAVRHATPLRAGAARNAGARLVATPLVAFLDADTRPQPGWLDALLPHFQDPRVAAVAPRIVGGDETRLGRYERRHSPLDRGPLPARVLPKGRVPFVPGAALVVRTQLARFDEELRGGEDVDLVWRLTAQGHHVRYEPEAQVEHLHRTSPRAWLARRAYYGRTAAPLALRHPGNARPLDISPFTAAAWLALAARRPKTAAAITAVATALFARRLNDPRLAATLVLEGTLGSTRLVTDALTRTYWPVAFLTYPKALSLAALTRPSLDTLDALAYGLGTWHGCARHRTFDPLLPGLSWRMHDTTGDALIELLQTSGRVPRGLSGARRQGGCF